MSFLWDHWYPCFGLLVTSALGFKARVDIACTFSCLHVTHQIHLWCDTCQPLDGQHGGLTHSLHASFSRGRMPGSNGCSRHGFCCFCQCLKVTDSECIHSDHSVTTDFWHRRLFAVIAKHSVSISINSMYFPIDLFNTSNALKFMTALSRQPKKCSFIAIRFMVCYSE